MQIEEYVAGNIKDLCKKRHVSKYRLAQLTGIAQSSLGRIVANESTPSLQTLEKICSALDVTLSQFFQDEKENHLTDKRCFLDFIKHGRINFFIETRYCTHKGRAYFH